MHAFARKVLLIYVVALIASLIYGMWVAVLVMILRAVDLRSPSHLNGVYVTALLLTIPTLAALHWRLKGNFDGRNPTPPSEIDDSTHDED